MGVIIFVVLELWVTDGEIYLFGEHFTYFKYLLFVSVCAESFCQLFGTIRYLAIWQIFAIPISLHKIVHLRS